MMKNKTRTLAGRLSRRLMLWLLVILIGLAYFVFNLMNRATRDFYSESYYNRTLINKEYTRRVISDVYVAVTNNIYYLEQNLDEPDNHKEVMKRIVKNGTRIRSCGVSFVKDYYYPQKGHRFCPFAWRSPVHLDVIEAADMGDSSLDYLDAEWFLNVIDTDSAQWSEPFYDGYDQTTTLIAYMAPIHDPSGRVVAALGADISLDWLTNKLIKTDSTINANASFASKILGENSHSFIINHDGKFITHPEVEHILKDNFFSHIEEEVNADSGLVGKIRSGISNEHEHYEECLFDGQKCYVFYTPIKYTDWTMVSVVPWQSIDTIGYLNGTLILLVLLLIMILIIVICYYSMRNVTKPIQQIIRATNHIAKGKFDTPMPEVKHDDELRSLCDSLANMQYSLSCYDHEKKTNV